MLAYWTLLLALWSLTEAQRLETMFQWTRLDFSWPDANARDQALRQKDYIVENNVITGIKVGTLRNTLLFKSIHTKICK